MKKTFLYFFLLSAFTALFLNRAHSLTPISPTDPTGKKNTPVDTYHKAERTTYNTTNKEKNPSFSAEKSPEAPVLTDTEKPKIQTVADSWIPEIGKFYVKEKLTPTELSNLIFMLEKNLGILSNGTLNLDKTREAQASLKRYRDDPEKSFSDIYFDDKQNLTGYNYIYFEMCTLHKDKYSDHFKRYFEKGFYPNKSLYVKEEYYYKSLYYYLYIVQNGMVSKLNLAVSQLNKSPNKAPSFSKNDIATFDTIVKVCTELDELRVKGGQIAESPYEKIFNRDERNWLNNSIRYFTDIDTHIALSSYPWFRANLPLSISANVISQNIKDTWIDQTVSYRAMLPLMLFSNQGGASQLSVDKLFADTMNKMKLDNREVDIVVMSALKTWLRKQVDHGVNVDDRLKYKDILDELDVCPTGWIFYNLYLCKKPLEEMKAYARAWDSYTISKRNTLFKTKIAYLYGDALEKITIVFSDLEKLFGKVGLLDTAQKTTGINSLFFRYRGEINYYYEYLQYGLYDGNTISSVRFPLANSRKNCLFDFKSAFVNGSDKKVNHENLINAYNLLFKELASQGKISDISRYEEEFDSYVTNENYRLGSLVGHADDDRYDIYRTVANAYLYNKNFQTRALKAAEKSYRLSRDYYMSAAMEAGYVQNKIPGALNNRCSEIDDFERQFEFYQDIALKLGKKIGLLLPGEDIELYNRLQNLRHPEGFLL